MAGRKAGGPESYEIGLLRCLAKLDRVNEYFIYCTGTYARDAIGPLPENFTYRILRPSIRSISIPLTLPAMLLSDGIDFYHSTFTPAPYAPKQLLFTVHCLSSLVHPEFYRPAVVWRLNKLLSMGIRSAECLVCVSQTTLDHVHEKFGISRDRMLVTYNGVAPEFKPIDPNYAAARLKESHGIDFPYVLYLGKMQAHKNVQRLVRAFHLYRRETHADTKLLLVGKDIGQVEHIKAIAAELGISDHVVVKGYLPFEDIPNLYAGARMFAFPSLWEGFGIPLVEAMSCGVPVVTSNVTCLPEIAADAAVIVDPYSVEALAEGMARIETDPQLRETLVQRGFARAQAFTWESCARSTLKAYERFAPA